MGDACVGKTALVNVFRSGGRNYPNNYVMTNIAEVAVKAVPIKDQNTNVELYLFDCAGQSIFHQDTSSDAMSHMDGAASVMLVFDPTSRESFKNCARWLQKVRTHLDRNIGGVLVANKVDLRSEFASDRVVTAGEGEGFAKEYGLRYFEASAKDGKDVDVPFKHIANQYFDVYKKYTKKVEVLVGAS